MEYKFDGKTTRYGQDVWLNGTLNIEENGVCEGKMHVKGAERENYKKIDYALEGRVSLKKVKRSLNKDKFITLWPNGREAPSVKVKIPRVEEYVLLEVIAYPSERTANVSHKIKMTNLSPQNKYAGTYYTTSAFMKKEAILTLENL